MINFILKFLCIYILCALSIFVCFILPLQIMYFMYQFVIGSDLGLPDPTLIRVAILFCLVMPPLLVKINGQPCITGIIAVAKK